MFSRTGVQVKFNGVISHAWASNHISSSSSSSSSHFGAIEFGGPRRITHNARLLGFQCLEYHELREQRPMQAAARRAADAAARVLHVRRSGAHTSHNGQLRPEARLREARKAAGTDSGLQHPVQRPDRRGHGGREDEPKGCPGCPAGPFSADTILLGHSLDSDLRALRLITRDRRRHGRRVPPTDGDSLTNEPCVPSSHQHLNTSARSSRMEVIDSFRG
ncbi:hypothetical protein MRX96_049027 [Rhipicephalus microplus]